MGKGRSEVGGRATVYNWEQLHNMPGAHFVSTAPRKLPKGQRAAATKCEGSSRGRGCVCVCEGSAYKLPPVDKRTKTTTTTTAVNKL